MSNSILNSPITVKETINANISKVWELYNSPEAIMQWNQASPDWHCPKSENDLRIGGHFKSTMAAKDGSFSFDFGGTYDEVVTNKLIKYTLEDGRRATITFEPLSESQTKITVGFDPESQNSAELQQQGWQAILDSFKKYADEQAL